MFVTDVDSYQDIWEEYELEVPDIDTVQEILEVSVSVVTLKEQVMHLAEFKCPFNGVSDCDYAITEFVGKDDDLSLIENAAAAHIVVTHSAPVT